MGVVRGWCIGTASYWRFNRREVVYFLCVVVMMDVVVD